MSAFTQINDVLLSCHDRLRALLQDAEKLNPNVKAILEKIQADLEERELMNNLAMWLQQHGGQSRRDCPVSTKPLE
jgi:hypothetical protein